MIGTDEVGKAGSTLVRLAVVASFVTPDQHDCYENSVVGDSKTLTDQRFRQDCPYPQGKNQHQSAFILSPSKKYNRGIGRRYNAVFCKKVALRNQAIFTLLPSARKKS